MAKTYKKFQEEWWSKHKGAKLADFHAAWNSEKESALSADVPKKVSSDNIKSSSGSSVGGSASPSDDSDDSGVIEVSKQEKVIVNDVMESTTEKSVPEGAEVEHSEEYKEVFGDGATAADSGASSQNPNVAFYGIIADSFHTALFGVANLATKGVISVDKVKIGRLNAAGSELIKKYDDNGFFEKYGAEIAYVITILAIGTEITMELKSQSDKKKSEEQPKEVLHAAVE